MLQIINKDHCYTKRRIFKEFYLLKKNCVEEKKFCQSKMSDHESLTSSVEEEGEEVASVQKKKLTSDELLINLVHGYPWLYDKTIPEFKDKGCKEGAWKEIGNILEKRPEEIQKQWETLRDRFTREKRMLHAESKSGSGVTKRLKFSLYNEMLFLDDFIRKRRTVGNTNQKSTYSDVAGTSGLANSNNGCNNGNINHSSPVSCESSPQLRPPKSRKIKEEDHLGTIQESLLLLSNSVNNRFAEKPKNTVDKDSVFTTFLTLQMNSLPEYKKIVLQSDITAMVCKTVADHLKEMNSGNINGN